MPELAKPHLLPDPRWAENMVRVQHLVQGARGYGTDWPPNHQWWNRADWIFPLSNMVKWGMGPALGIAACLAWLLSGLALFRRRHWRLIIPWLWTSIFFGYYGMQWVKTMRYQLPNYAPLMLLAAFWLVHFWDRARYGPAAEDEASLISVPNRGALKSLAAAAIIFVIGGTWLYGYMFTRIYARDHSRIGASYWMYYNIPTAMGLRVAEPDLSQRVPVSYLPARLPDQIELQPESYDYIMRGDDWIGPAKVRAPLDADQTVNGVQLAFLQDPGRDQNPETISVILGGEPFLDESGQPKAILSEGQAAVDLGSEPQHVQIDMPEVVLPATGRNPKRPRGLERLFASEEDLEPPIDENPPKTEYYLWIKVDGGPIQGRTSIIAHQTGWDDTVPRGLYGYSGYDQKNTPDWSEGLFGFEQLSLYGNDEDPNKIPSTFEILRTVDYTIATSNRVYGSTAQLPTRYPATNVLYDAFFGEEHGVVHTLSFSSFPTLGSWEVDDQSAEEAFHVYDHPQVDVWDVRNADLDQLQAVVTAARDEADRRSKLDPEDPDFQAWFREPEEARTFTNRYLPFVAFFQGLWPFGDDAEEEAAIRDDAEEAKKLLLDESRQRDERDRADFVFDPGGWSNNYPMLAVGVWYLALALIGLLAFPLLHLCFPNLGDRGWALARPAGLLLLSWMAWILASFRLFDHTPNLVTACLLMIAAASVILHIRTGGEAINFLKEQRRSVLVSEGIFFAIFAIFLMIRTGNPDLWHPYYGGEKPMDFAYLNATLRSVSFPPFDPWFSGGKLNYYYYGFVFVGALMELTRIVPWVAYNLAVPSLAAMTGLGAYGVVKNWAAAMGLHKASALRGGLLAALFSVLMGNLAQIQLLGQKLSELHQRASDPGEALYVSEIPGLTRLVHAILGLSEISPETTQLPGILGKIVDTFAGLGQLILDPVAALPSVPLGHWYWNASRAIPAQGETIPITEMPFFTFVYADLHAHMMAMPIGILAFGLALSWAIPTRPEMDGDWLFEPWGIGRLLWIALAIGALWPTNTWDFPTYGLVAAGALAAGLWQRLGGPSWAWVVAVGWRGGILLATSLLLFRPYHRDYVTPYSDFNFWTSTKTPAASYITVHGIFLFAILSYMLWRIIDAFLSREERKTMLLALPIFGFLSWFTFSQLWEKTTGIFSPESAFPPDPRTAVIGAVLITIGLAVLVLPGLKATERFAAWLLVLGVLLTQFVEYGVLAGDIHRMNTVFKFYIQVWLLWAVLAAAAYAWLDNRWRSRASRAPQAVPDSDGALAASLGADADAIAQEGDQQGPAVQTDPELASVVATTESELALAGAKQEIDAAAGDIESDVPDVDAIGSESSTENPMIDAASVDAESATERTSVAGKDMDVDASKSPTKQLGQVQTKDIQNVGPPVWFGLWRFAFSLLVFSGLTYSYTAARGKVADRFSPALALPQDIRDGYEDNYQSGLSGMDYLDYAHYFEELEGAQNGRAMRLGDDRDAMIWLLENVEGSPTVLEAYNPRGGYRWGNRFAIYTGLPSVIGWDWHQRQQRNAGGHTLVWERVEDVKMMYDSPDEGITQALIDKYRVEYVVVGEQERVFYQPAGLAKFDRWVEEGKAELVYSGAASALNSGDSASSEEASAEQRSGIRFIYL